MRNARRTAALAAAAGCLTIGGALGSGLLNAGAATSGSSTNGAPSSGSGQTKDRDAVQRHTGRHGFGHHCHHGDRDGGSSGTDSTVVPDDNIGV
jgi:hypothetical protein